MSLDIKYWWVRWYLWSLYVYSAARHDEYMYSRFSKMTNLCFFMRVSLVYGPLILISHLALIGLFFAAFFLVPWQLFGLGYLKFIGILVSGMTFVAGLIYFCSVLFPRMVRSAADVAVSVKDVCANAINNPKPTNFAVICIQYLRSVKERSCPLIVLEDKDA